MRNILYFFITLSSISMFSQTDSINLVVSIDNEFEKIRRASISSTERDLNIVVKIIPGQLIISQSDMTSLKDQEDNSSLILSFESSFVCNNKVTNKFYEIPIKYEYLKFEYLLIKIYNIDYLDNKKYIDPLPNKTYNYQLHYPNSDSRIINKKLKGKCGN